MRVSISVLFIINTLLHRTIALNNQFEETAAALPSPSPSPSPTSQQPSSPEAQKNAEAQQNELYKKHALECILYNPPQDQQTLNDCRQACGPNIPPDENGYKSTSCVGWWPSPDPKNSDIPWAPDPQVKNGLMVKATCTCNNALINFAAKTFADAMPILGDIVCAAWSAAIQVVIEVGSVFIPGAGEALDAGMITGIQAAKLANYVSDSAEDALKQFIKSMSPCGNSGGQTPPLPPDSDMEKAFGIMTDVPNDKVPGPGNKKGWSPPAGIKPGKNAGGSKGPDPPKNDDPENDPPKNDDPKNDPPKNDDPKKDPPKTDSPKTDDNSNACGKQKRGNNNCGTVTEHWTAVASSSASSTKTVPVTCNNNLDPQACAHYYSAIHLRGQPSLFECTDDNKRMNAQATSSWTKQHKNREYWQYTDAELEWSGTKYQAGNWICGADEYPPGYFWGDKTTGQLVRWIPQQDNADAGGLWQNFCNTEDGGKNNGQTIRAGSSVGNMNQDGALIKTVGKEKGKHTEDPVEKVRGTKTVTVWTTFDVQYQRAAFQLAFSPGYKGGDDDYMLSKNPCWPKSIVPDDPGFCLLTDDEWYKSTAKPEAKKYTDSYGDKKAGIPKELLAKAGNKQPPSPNTGDPGDDDQAFKRSLQVLGDGLAIRDVNLTRRITDEEAARNIQIINCRDHDCSRERRALANRGDDSYVVFPGDPPPKEPPQNIDTIPTAVARHAREFPAAKRHEISPELPAPTAVLG